MKLLVLAILIFLALIIYEWYQDKRASELCNKHLPEGVIIVRMIEHWDTLYLLEKRGYDTTYLNTFKKRFTVKDSASFRDTWLSGGYPDTCSLKIAFFNLKSYK
jgi:hypothetical protein